MKPLRSFGACLAFGLLAFGFSAIFLTGCKTIDQSDFVRAEPPPEYKSASFSYNPSTTRASTTDSSESDPSVSDSSTSDTAAVSIGIGKARYSSRIRLEDPLRKKADSLSGGFKSSISGGLERVLDSNGFSVSGKFTDLGQMTFPEKEETTMVLLPVIDITVSSKSEKAEEIYWRSEAGSGKPKKMPLEIFRGEVALGGKKYVREGEMRANANVRIQLVEPLTEETLLAKEFSIEDQSKEWIWYYWVEEKLKEGRVPGQDANSNAFKKETHSVKGYDGRRGALASVFTNAYDDIMGKVENSLSNREISQLKEDAVKLKERWRVSNE